ncbi:MAG TPA: hypothetical protein VK586_24065 [Streptosporangiaceae bacterium]|nr:hypothetical protein [Streptosporangiaceae bacterium]
MAKFRNDTGSVLNSAEFGLIGPGEFELDGYDPDVHGVIPGCTRLDVPETTEAPDDAKPPAKRGKAAGQDKETGE